MSRRAPLRAAIVGAGLMGRWHADAIVRAGGVVGAVVDPDPRRARGLATAFPGCRVAGGLWEIVRDGGLDVAHICSPSASHAALVGRALDVGLHVLVEKPLAPTVEETADLPDQASVAGRLVCPVHQLLFQHGVLRAQALATRIGPLVHLDAVMCSAGADGQDDRARERIASEILPHPLALFRRIAGVSIDGLDWQVAHPAPGELRAQAPLPGATLALTISMAGRPPVNQLRLTGRGGTVHVDLVHGFAVVEPGSVGRLYKVARPFVWSVATLGLGAANLVGRAIRRNVAYPGLRELVQHFYDAVATGGESPIGRDEVLDVAAARDVLLRLADIDRDRHEQAGRATPGSSARC